ncbi:SDR family oxidoreductase [Pseudonocardia spinosispora]|uniref:SDR family oxidoreductase n=1 Tax=Pseudonocardia spinosispora TaxID=103441 RepID=UPI00041EE627|nr:SDR family NAD(P)-dependent oxidoreductase [Pseudonocardia spinosispora]
MAGAVVIGAGEGIGAAVARRFAKEGLPVALVARRAGTVDAVAETLRPSGVPVVRLTADAADDDALRGALDAAAAELGPADVVVYNAAIVQLDALGDLSSQGLLDALAVNVAGAATTAAHLLPGMAQRGSGTFVVTGGMPEPKPFTVSLSVSKAAVRALVGLLDEQFRDSGVHVATVTVDGPVAPGTAFDPDDIAEHYWRLHTQPKAEWETNVLHTDKTP